MISIDLSNGWIKRTPVDRPNKINVTIDYVLTTVLINNNRFDSASDSLFNYTNEKMIRNCQINNIDLNDLTPNYYANISNGSIPNNDDNTI